MPGWAQHTIWWHLHPLGFTGAERTALPAHEPPVARLRSLEPWLDHLIDLGANGLALGPVFASETHGYDTVEHLAVDRRLGTDDDLRWLFDACHARGIRVLLDGVFNHVGRGFPAFQDVLAHGRASRYAGWFRLDWHDDDRFDHADFEGHHHLVALDHGNPEVADHVVEVMGHWLDAGADGWRLDAAYSVPPAFWREVTDRVRATHPDAWFVGEVIHGPYEPWLTDAGLDAVTQYELWKAMWSAVNDRNLFELAWALDRHAALVEVGTPMTFLGNHDVTRIATKVADPRHHDHVGVLLLTLPGVPSIYAGDDHGFTGEKTDTATGDDAVRPAFPADPSQLLPFGWPRFQRTRELIALRRRHPWLTTATIDVLELSNRQLAYRAHTGDESLVVLLNLDDEVVRFDQAADATGTDVHRIAGGASADGEPGDPALLGDDPWQLAPHGWAVVAP